MSDGLEVQKCSDFEPKNWKNESVFPQKSMKFGLKKVRKDLNMDLNCTRTPYNCKTTNLTLYFRHRFTFIEELKDKVLLFLELFRP